MIGSTKIDLLCIEKIDQIVGSGDLWDFLKFVKLYPLVR